jgi:membrane-associated phospholipid phosphatase
VPAFLKATLAPVGVAFYFAPMPHPRSLVLLVAGLLCTVAPGVRAQDAPGTAEGAPSAPGGLDRRLLYAVYRIDDPLFEGAMRAADLTAFPLFALVPAAAWAGAWLEGEGRDWTPAYRLSLSEAAALAGLLGVKHLVRRPRPYAALPDVTSRAGPRSAALMARFDPFSFPSAHAALSFALVTSWSLSYPRWYVIAPGLVWASGVSLSRLWLGVHYPTDVLVGALVGAAAGLGVHLLAPVLTPAFLEADAQRAAPPMLHLRLSFR